MTAFPPLPNEVSARTVPQLLRAAAEARSGHTALVAHSLVESSELSVSYGELAERARRLAGALGERDVAHGDRVAIMVTNAGSVEAHTAYHATHMLGGINVPINTFYVERELEYVLGFIEPAAIVFGSEFGPLVRRVLSCRAPDHRRPGD